MPDTPLWQPSAARIQQSHLQAFTQHLKAQGLNTPSAKDYPALHRWSVEHSAEFWRAVWDYCGVIGEPGTQTIRTEQAFTETRFFPEAKLNFAENLLYMGGNNDSECALISRLENGQRQEISYGELRQQVKQLAASFEQLGLGPGDRIAVLMPNCAETLIAMLACTSIGATWTSCSPDFGSNGIVDRFGQTKPSLLLACNGYFYNGKTIDTQALVADICQRIDSIEQLLWVELTPAETKISCSAQQHDWDSLVHSKEALSSFPRFDFDHPLAIMYSSGTTGKPKCIVHGCGGSLLQHLKEHQLHTDIKAGDRLFYYSTCGWMMWNWLVSGLASGATLVLFDGSPFYPQPSALIDMIDEEDIGIFGVSAKYIAALEKAGLKPRESHRLEQLRSILSTGSPLAHESFDYVYRDIKADVCLSSISGGTDILSCFALGNSCLPVYRGELQCLGLGMAVDIWDEQGNSLKQEKGELVCSQAFPSKPIGFWQDHDGSRYKKAYFSQWPNIWAHGDYGEITANGGVIIHGRSDAVLNPGGVRIGTAEIYRQVEKIDSVVESICIGQRWQDDVRVVLFVVLRQGEILDDTLRQRIRDIVRREATPRHVPSIIEQVPDIPRTISGKIVELAVRNVVHGEAVKNTDALANPEALEHFRDIAALQA